jgi:hypothetical protein
MAPRIGQQAERPLWATVPLGPEANRRPHVVHAIGPRAAAGLIHSPPAKLADVQHRPHAQVAKLPKVSRRLRRRPAVNPRRHFDHLQPLGGLTARQPSDASSDGEELAEFDHGVILTCSNTASHRLLSPIARVQFAS